MNKGRDKVDKLPVPEPERITQGKQYPLGIIFRTDNISYRYACAGEELKKGTLLEMGLEGLVDITPGLPNGMQVHELIYGDIRAAQKVDRHGINILGWPNIDVPKGWHFWLQEPPPGAKFEMES